jgi:hypothetical protein
MLGWKPKFKDPNVASVRYRCLNPLAELRQRGLPIELFHESKLHEYSGVIFSKLYDDNNYEIARGLKRMGKAVVFDICDNHFYNPYGLKEFKLVREQLLRMLSVADLIVTSTELLADVVKEEGRLSQRPTVIGDAIEDNLVHATSKSSWLETFRSRCRFRPLDDNHKANVLWFGIQGGENSAYGMLDILNCSNLLIHYSKIYPLRLIVVSNSREKFIRHIKQLPLETIYYDWSVANFREVVRRTDIAIIPITRNPFTLCKSNNRLATTLYAGIPTVADEIPSYRDLGRFCVLNDWEEGLQMYLNNKTISPEDLKLAKTYVADHYTIRHIGDRWAEQLTKFFD